MSLDVNTGLDANLVVDHKPKGSPNQLLSDFPPQPKPKKKNSGGSIGSISDANHVVNYIPPKSKLPKPKPEPKSKSPIHNLEDANSMVSFLKLRGPKIICLWVVFGIIDILLVISLTLYLVHHSTDNDETNMFMNFRSIADIFTCLYRIMILILCYRFTSELLQGNMSPKEAADKYPDYQKLASKPRTANNYSCCEKFNYLFEDLELNQFTIAAVLCTVHQLFNAMLLFISVYNGADRWYILTGIAYFLGAFSINTIPGICFNQYLVYGNKQKHQDLISDHDEAQTIISRQSNLSAIKIAIFSDGFIQFFVFVGFLIELIKFCCVPALNHEDIMTMQRIIYHCIGGRCDHRPEFVLCELILRIFVGIAIFNNLVLLGSVLTGQLHSETSLTHILKIFSPICYILLFLSLLMDFRVNDYYWNIEYKTVHSLWIGIHFVGMFIIFKLLCVDFYSINHYIIYKEKRGDIHATTSLFIEASLLGIFSFMSTLFISFDQEILIEFLNSQNMPIWRQWSMIIYNICQIPLLYYSNRIQQFESFAIKLQANWNGKYFGIRRCFEWIAFINTFDLIYSFMFEAREYDQVMNGGEIESDEHYNVNLYKWAYSLSFTTCHLVLLSLCCVIEFIVKYDQIVKNQKLKKELTSAPFDKIGDMNSPSLTDIPKSKNTTTIHIRHKSIGSVSDIQLEIEQKNVKIVKNK